MAWEEYATCSCCKRVGSTVKDDGRCLNLRRSHRGGGEVPLATGMQSNGGELGSCSDPLGETAEFCGVDEGEAAMVRRGVAEVSTRVEERWRG